MTAKRGFGSGGRELDETVNAGGIAVTHPKKVWWPKERISKLDVVHYYAAVAPHILPWLNEHPLTAERCPDGITGECFFQKNFAEDLAEYEKKAQETVNV